MKKRLMSHQYLFGVVCIISLTLLSVIYEKQPCQGFDSLTPAVAAEPPILYFFWGEGCPHFEYEKMFFDVLQQDYPQLEIRLFEICIHPEFAILADALGKTRHLNASGVPITFLGNWGNVGFESFETTGVQIAEQVKRCLQDDCPDALEQLGDQELAARIRREAAQHTPQNWELRPAVTVANAPAKKIAVYYFHGNYRCPSCTTIEELTNFSIINGFKKELESGQLVFQAINVETPENQHFVKDYHLYTKSLIVSDVFYGVLLLDVVKLSFGGGLMNDRLHKRIERAGWGASLP